MAANDRSEELREAARHRGLKLVKSRRRKPGTGDYGRFGLTDAGGKKLFGFTEDGLTATADDIAAYLRKGAAATWAESARTASGPPTKAKRRRAAPVAEPDPEQNPAAEEQPSPPPERARTKGRADQKPPSEPLPKKLAVRKAKAGDARHIAALCDIDADSVAKFLRGATSLLVADRGGLIGCIAWHPVPTLQSGLIGRITMIAVAGEERRQGIGAALVGAAREEMKKQGCTLVEAMSDIEVRNAHGFFRALGFRQASYRFTLG